MKTIPISDKFSQSLSVILAGQNCIINLYQKDNPSAPGLYLDLYINDALIIAGVICENLNRLIRDDYFGFIGDLFFQDTQGLSDPASPGLGSRFLLQYLESSDLSEG